MNNGLGKDILVVLSVVKPMEGTRVYNALQFNSWRSYVGSYPREVR
jgi:hypothetical protein